MGVSRLFSYHFIGRGFSSAPAVSRRGLTDGFPKLVSRMGLTTVSQKGLTTGLTDGSHKRSQKQNLTKEGLATWSNEDALARRTGRAHRCDHGLTKIWPGETHRTGAPVQQNGRTGSHGMGAPVATSVVSLRTQTK